MFCGSPQFFDDRANDSAEMYSAQDLLHPRFVVRAAVLTLLVALCGCPSLSGDRLAAEDDTGGQGNGSGAGSGSGGGGVSLPPNCAVDTDCVVAGPRCCDCPTHAVPDDDPAQLACQDVDCGPMSCGSPTQAACKNNYCTLVCSPVACDPSITCDAGFATDENGCLTCTCAGAADVGGECTTDNQCSRVRADCCGCDNGGYDTAVPTSQAASFDNSLYCPANPTCPGGNVCAADLAARCVQGTCSLVAGPLPGNACGRAGLPACATGEQCYVNASDQATMHGVGVCQP